LSWRFEQVFVVPGCNIEFSFNPQHPVMSCRYWKRGTILIVSNVGVIDQGVNSQKKFSQRLLQWVFDEV
jgi:hypothetical protein